MIGLGASTGWQQVRRRVRRGRGREYVFVAHPTDTSGAPLVLLQVVTEYIERYGPRRVRLLTPSFTEAAAPGLEALPIMVEKSARMGSRLSGMQLALDRDDFVMLNTCSVHRGYLEYVLGSLESDRLAHAYWFIHEDVELLRTSAPRLLEESSVIRISRLLNDGALTVMVPSEAARRSYNSMFLTQQVSVVAHRVDVPDHYQQPRTVDAFGRLDFMLAGPPFGGRKGHELALAAFEQFMNAHYRQDPSRYREFALHLVGLRGDDELSQRIRATAAAVLGERLHVYLPLPREQALEVTAACNAVISCSDNETFGLSVAEAMLMHHVVLRNDTGGVDEQLRDGENGYFIGHNDAGQFATVIERLLNRVTTSDADLHRMGETSHQLMAGYATNSYLAQIDSLPAGRVALTV